MLETDPVCSAGVRAWDARRHAAPRWEPGTAPMVVVVPHPDDEALGVGGLIAHQRWRGVDVYVVAVTDGESAYDAAGDADLAATRVREQNEALDHLGVAPGARARLGFPDSRVAEFEDELADELFDILLALAPDATLVAPSCRDVHPDHEAVGRAARRAAAARGCELISYHFWMWHLRHPDEVDIELVALELSGDTATRKAAAIAAHRSQFDPPAGIPPVLTAERLQPAMWPHEIVSVERP